MLNKIIILFIILLLLSFNWLIQQKTEKQEIEKELKEQIIIPKIQPYKGEIPQAIGAVQDKIKLYDLELTETEYAEKKTELVNKYKTKQLNWNDGQRFIAVLNREIALWKQLNKQDFIISNFKGIDDIILKLNL